MYNLHRRLEKAEKQLCVNEPPVVFEYTDDNGVEQRVELPAHEFDRILKEIKAKGKGLQIRERIGI